MFILREVSPQREGLATNTELIGRYTPINKHLHPNEFERTLSSDEFHDPESIFGFVISNNGQNTEILRNGREYYIMSENGRTIEHLRFYGGQNEEEESMIEQSANDPECKQNRFGYVAEKQNKQNH